MSVKAKWGTPKEIETQRRIKVSLWAYAYEIHNDPLVSDGVFDYECYMVDLSIDTDRPNLDKWFRDNFEPCTGLWIYSHPDIKLLEKIYHEVKQ